MSLRSHQRRMAAAKLSSQIPAASSPGTVVATRSLKTQRFRKKNKLGNEMIKIEQQHLTSKKNLENPTLVVPVFW